MKEQGVYAWQGIPVRFTGLVLAVSLVWVVGCKTPEQYDTSGDDVPAAVIPVRSVLIARDLAESMSNLPSLDPGFTNLQMLKPNSEYGRVLAAELKRVGYSLRPGVDRTAANFLDYSIIAVEHSDGPAYEFSVSVGDVALRRSYLLDGNRIKPISTMKVKGGVSEEFAGQVLADTIAVNTTSASNADPVSSGLLLSIPSAERHNMYLLGESNFENVTQQYSDVRKEILVFDNDSIIMGKTNRSIARKLAAEFDPESDVISVIGCSHGKTDIEDGNRALALGRSSRVREELILAGVDPARVLDEGCWAGGKPFESFPRRGVVVTLKRNPITD